MNALRSLALVAGLVLATAAAAAGDRLSGPADDAVPDNYTRCSFALGEAESGSESSGADCVIVARMVE